MIQSPEQEDDELLSQMDEKDNVLEQLGHIPQPAVAAIETA